MAKIEEAFGKLMKLEFNSATNALEYNVGEKGYTFMGIYEVAHPEFEGWSIIKAELAKGDKVKASVACYNNLVLRSMVIKFYKREFWDRMRLDEVVPQHTAEEMLVFGVNAGIKSAVKAAQEVVGVDADGVIGSKTIAALNGYDVAKFDAEYDKKEIAHYEMLVAKNPSFERNIKGWKNRAVAV